MPTTCGEIGSSEVSSLNDNYERDGFLIAPRLLTDHEVDALLAETLAISRGQRGSLAGALSDADDPGTDEEVLSRFIAIRG